MFFKSCNQSFELSHGHLSSVRLIYILFTNCNPPKTIQTENIFCLNVLCHFIDVHRDINIKVSNKNNLNLDFSHNCLFYLMHKILSAKRFENPSLKLKMGS